MIMKYYRLEDREHKDIIVKANGAEQYIYINGKWIRTGIMIEYMNDESEYYDLYTEITEEESKKYCLL